LLEKLESAAEEQGIKEITLAGGVAANSYLRKKLKELAEKNNWNIYIPDFQYCTDNAAMVAVTAYYKYMKGDYDKRELLTYSTK
jgi:N6-L-threonylcarbamoyladenine synthase